MSDQFEFPEEQFPKPIIYHLFAQIGAGKSWKIRHRDQDILHAIEVDLKVPYGKKISADQIHWELQHSKHWTLLPLFYENPPAYGYLFQFEIMTSYVKQVATSLRTHPEKKVMVLESGPLESFSIYQKRLFDHGCMSTFEYESMRPIMDWWRKSFEHRVIYLDVKDTVCLQHIQQRKTPKEVEAINLELLTSLSHYRRNYLESDCPYPVYELTSTCTCESCSSTTTQK